MRYYFGIAFAASVIALCALPFLGIYPVSVMIIMCWALFACAFNLLLGFAGLLSFGHAMFFGAAGYVAGYAMVSWNTTPEVALFLATAFAGALGLVVGGLAIRQQGIYLAMITLALSQFVYFTLVQAPFTGGQNGLQGVPRGHLFGVFDLSDDLSMYYFVTAVFVISYLMIQRIVRSPFGEVLRAVRENEPRAISLGFSTDRHKLLAFGLSGAFSGLAGGTKALVLGVVTLGDAHWHASGEVVLMTIVGGVGTLLGPVIGATIIDTLRVSLSDVLGPGVTVVMGLIFVICVISFRQGIVGTISEFCRKNTNGTRASDNSAVQSARLGMREGNKISNASKTGR